MTGAALLLARLVLAAVFAVAGVAKLLDRAGSERALAAFGAPARAARVLAVALPLAECALAAALLPVATAWAASVGALLLLCLFTAAIALSLARGRAPDCHCFGQLHSAPAGPSTLARNALLAALAGFLVWRAHGDPGPAVFAALAGTGTGTGTGTGAWPALALATGAALLLLSAAQGAVLLLVVRQQGRLLLRLEAMEGSLARQAAARPPVPPTSLPAAPAAPPRRAAGLPVGAAAPAFALATPDGDTISLAGLLAAGDPQVLIFTSPKCGPCLALTPEITHWSLDADLPAGLVLVSEGGVQENVLKFAGVAHAPVVIQQRREVAEAYQAHGTPAAVLVRPDATIGSPLALGADAIRALIESLPAPTARRHTAALA